MKSSFSIKSILAASLVLVTGLMSSTATAYDLSSSNVYNCHWDVVTNSIKCSIKADAVLRGLRNVTRVPVAYNVTLSELHGYIFCTNPADNSSEANGTPYDPSGELGGAQAIAPDSVAKNGKTLGEIEFDDPLLLDAFNYEIDCPNSNWNQRVVITQLRAFGQLVTDGDEAVMPTACDLTSEPPFVDDSCTPQDNLVNDCALPEPYFSNPQLAIDTIVPYNCSQRCEDTDYASCNPSLYPFAPPTP